MFKHLVPFVLPLQFQVLVVQLQRRSGIFLAIVVPFLNIFVQHHLRQVLQGQSPIPSTLQLLPLLSRVVIDVHRINNLFRRHEDVNRVKILRHYISPRYTTLTSVTNKDASSVHQHA